MNTALWVVQAFLTLVFLYSGLMKATQTEQKLVAMGQTGVAGLPMLLIRFIGVSELAGAAGLIIPWLTQIIPWLTSISALCLGMIMLPAALIHYRRHEPRTVGLNIVIGLLCGYVAYGRWVS